MCIKAPIEHSTTCDSRIYMNYIITYSDISSLTQILQVPEQISGEGYHRLCEGHGSRGTGQCNDIIRGCRKRTEAGYDGHQWTGRCYEGTPRTQNDLSVLYLLVRQLGCSASNSTQVLAKRFFSGGLGGGRGAREGCGYSLHMLPVWSKCLSNCADSYDETEAIMLIYTSKHERRLAVVLINTSKHAVQWMGHMLNRLQTKNWGQ